MKNSNRYSFPLLLKSIRRVLSGLKRNTIREHYPSRNVLSTYLKFHYYTCPVNENYSHPSVWIGNGKHGGESVLQRDKFACMNLPAPPAEACRNKDKRSLELKKLFPTRVYIRMRFSAVETQQQSPLPIHFYSFFDFILLKSMRRPFHRLFWKLWRPKPGKKCFCKRIFFFSIDNKRDKKDLREIFFDTRSFWKKETELYVVYYRRI